MCQHVAAAPAGAMAAAVQGTRTLLLQPVWSDAASDARGWVGGGVLGGRRVR